jgi:protein-S-isoprenylcysteine O-methyltransferase Ste14
MNTLRLLSLGGFIILVLAMVGLVFRGAIFAVEPFGMTVQVLSFALMIWARVTFGRRSFHAAADPTAGGIVTAGPYRVLRHPIYAAIGYFLWTGAISHASALNLMIALAATAGIAVRIVAEERLLVERYPEYADYAARTKRVVPFLL